MKTNVHEIRVLLGLCVRGLEDIREDETADLTQSDRMELQEIGEKVEEAHNALRPWAPDEW